MYENIAEDYDRFVNWKNRLAYEMPFLINQIEKIQSPPGKSLQILETACGTAMHAIALAKLGHRLSAADISPQMVEKSRLNAHESGVDLQIKIAGFGSLSTAFGGTSFDLLLCLGNSLPHLSNPRQIKGGFGRFYCLPASRRYAYHPKSELRCRYRKQRPLDGAAGARRRGNGMGLPAIL